MKIYLFTLLWLMALLSFLYPREQECFGDPQVERSKTALTIERPGGLGGCLETLTLPAFPEKVWLQTEHVYRINPREAEAYLVVEVEGDSTPVLWAAGYSLAGQAIRIGNIARAGDGSWRFRPLHQKKIEILNPENEYVFRWIFWPGRAEMQIDVNGAPLKAARPFRVDQIRRVGVMVRGGPVRFQPLQVDGR